MIEKGTKRRGRPRADARASNEPTATHQKIFREIQRKKNDGSSAREKPRLCDLIDDNEMDKVDERTRIEVDCPVETEDACSFSSDISDVSLDFESGDRARNISVVSSKSSKMRDLALDNLHGDQTRPLYKPRPRLLSGYNVPANTMLSHIERPECRSVRERNTAQRVQLKRELFNQFHEVDRECSAPNLVDASSVQKMTGVKFMIYSVYVFRLAEKLYTNVAIFLK
uniref:Uncharacterized protein n=1 Tax=Parascaris equorum TaxID=6256 RepID=A0A914S017_PAREQ